MASSIFYRGRFAPSPTGPLHFGSLVAAVGSYLDAKHHQGKWLVRIEDLDTPRTVKGAADSILRTLEAFGLHWDESVLYQSQRTAAYEEVLQQLQTIDAVYLCACTRKEIADSALSGIEGQIYPGTCRNGVLEGREGRAWRVRMDTPFPAPSPGGRRELDSLSHRGNQRLSCDLLQLSRMAITSHLPRTLGLSGMANSHISCFIQRVREGGVVEFNDTLQGVFTQHLETEIGDFVIKRADGLFAYQLAVVADDAFQNITHVVRGCDLLTSTPRQIFLQRLLGLTTPAYMHLPVAVNAQGEKLSKQTLAAPVDISSISHTLLHALNFLNQATPTKLAACKPTEILGWAIAHWDKEKLKGIKQITVD